MSFAFHHYTAGSQRPLERHQFTFGVFEIFIAIAPYVTDSVPMIVAAFFPNLV